MSSYYLAARQLEFYKGRNSPGPNTNALANALAITQHHDVVSVTQSQHVPTDYALRISKGYAEASELVASSLESLTTSRSSSNHEKTVGVFQQVPASEAVRITQGIAYKVQVPIDGTMRSYVFIDTPGHEAVYCTAYGHCLFRKTEENQLPWDIMLNGNE
ncbi:alpha-mannosidase At3g26720-like isoform X1 [Rutidosis leptorrhynchoides]|uniref:alpha-mannosidase At3g26720-like isoform X1 n=1 Tax=Rutidosis leptorrhynchoides TaxID=125765 RepID=UPI003A99521D